MFDSLFSNTTDTVEIVPLLICIVVALALGLVLSLVYCVRSRHTKSFVMTLAVLPAIVCVVIALVNGNVGTGVAVAGAFSLIRFRSVPGSARDIGFVFLAMAVGLACGEGYVGAAVLVTLVIGAAYLVYQLVGFGRNDRNLERTIHITIPESIDYTTVFDDVFSRYTTECDLVSVKTTNMGSLFRLVYNVRLLPGASEKDLIDELRCRNGNLEISLTYQEVTSDVL